MSLSTAIKNRDLQDLEDTVTKAVAAYKTAKPAAVSVDTVHGTLLFSALWDEDSPWAVIAGAYASILQDVSRIPAGLDKAVETAKIISSNAVMRNVSATAVSDKDDLL